MRFVVAVVGKPRDANLAGAIREYETRAGRYWPIEVHEVREEPARSGSADLVRKKEGERLLAAVPDGASLIKCDQSGKTMSSEQFAKWLQDFRERARDRRTLSRPVDAAPRIGAPRAGRANVPGGDRRSGGALPQMIAARARARFINLS